MEAVSVSPRHHFLFHPAPQPLRFEHCAASLDWKQAAVSASGCTVSLASDSQRLQNRALSAASRYSSFSLLKRQQHALQLRRGAVECTARATEQTSKVDGGERNMPENSGGSTMGQEGEEPYRVLPGGRKVYLKESDILAFLEEENYLRPLDPLAYNSAAYLWKKIADIPEERRTGLLDLLKPRHLTKMWKIAGRRYNDLKDFPQSTKAFAMMPTSEAEGALVFEGLVNGVPWPLWWVKRFSKAFFVSGDGKVYGRVIGGGKLLEERTKTIFPLYYRVKRVKAVVPTDEPCELAFEYGDGQLHLAQTGVPECFPRPAKHPYPFSDALYDYLRPVGPGVLIGQSWQEGNDPNATPRQFLGEFILIQRKAPVSSE